jgi:hypothetical protein
MRPQGNDTIEQVGPLTGTGQGYATALGELWPGVEAALGRLNTIAGDPYSYDPEALAEQLAHLQYRLHVGSEHVAGLDPPPGAETAHAELADALACARDATGEVTEALDDAGLDGLHPLLHEWRGALFRVRLARLRLAAPAPQPEHAAEPESPELIRPMTAFLLALCGAVAFAGGATLGYWPVWVAGAIAVAGGMLTYRP